MFVIIMSSVYLLGNLYIFIRGWQALSGNLPFPVLIIISILYWISALLLIAMFTFRGFNFPLKAGHIMHQVGTGWLVFTLYMVMFLIVTDILRLVINYPYSFFTALGLTLCLLLYGNYKYHHPKIRIVDLNIDKVIPSPRKQLKIVGISDIHLGLGTGKSQLKKYVGIINAQQPDMVLIAGDLIDNNVKPVWEQQLQEELSQINAPMGVFMALGNHEYISGVRESIEFIESTPIHLLRDTVITLPNNVQIAGRDDRMNRSRKSIAELTREVNFNQPIIMIDHQPFDLEETADAGIDLQFSGHTHAGQVWPLSLYVKSLFELSHGYMKKGNSHFYVSSGLSLWGPPFRIGTDSELVVFNLTFK